MTEVKRCMIASAAYVSLSRSLAEGLAGNAGAHMWLTPLSPTGALPATHYISSGYIKEDFALMMTDAQAIYDACVVAGMSVPLATIQAMLAASDITEEEPFTAMARLGLKMIVEET